MHFGTQIALNKGHFLHEILFSQGNETPSCNNFTVVLHATRKITFQRQVFSNFDRRSLRNHQFLLSNYTQREGSC